MKEFNLEQLKKEAKKQAKKQAEKDQKAKRRLDCMNIARIASRAEALFIELDMEVPDRVAMIMDIEFTHEICPLDLDQFHNASPGDFSHDIGGILKHFNRETKKLDGGFAPRCAVKDEDEDIKKNHALCKHLDIDSDEAQDLIESEDYLVLTDNEADEKAAEYIKDSLWAFNASFIIEHSDLPSEAEEMVKSHQEKLCEGANETIAAMINDIDEFIEAAIGADGRGHFMSSCDGEEHEVGDYFIYRIN